METCVNCACESKGKHCPECGQRLSVKQVTFRGMISEFLSKWIGFDNQFGRTMLGLYTSPNSVITSYLNGNRVKYLGPLAYLVIMTALLILSFDLFGVKAEDFMKTQSNLFQQEVKQDANQIELQKKVFKFLGDNMRFVSGAMIPFWSVTLGWFFRKKYLLAERMVIATYFSCQSIWITIIFVGISAITNELYSKMLFIIPFLYYGYALYNLFPEKKWSSFLKGIFSYLSAFFLAMIISIIIGVLIGASFAILYPEMFE